MVACPLFVLQVRQLTSDMSELKTAHAAPLAATQQRLQSLTEQLAAQQLNSLTQQQQQQQPRQSVANSPTPTDPPSPVLKARTSPQRPKSAAAAAAATVRPLTTAAAAAAAGPSRPGSWASKPSWVITGSAALIRQECVKDSLYAGALIDSNAGKDIRLAVDGSSSSSGSGNGGSGSGWGCRPSTAPGRGARVGSSCSDVSNEEAALLLRLRQQVERQVASELQQKASALLQVYTATPAAATSAAPAEPVEASALGADATAAAAAVVAATAETVPAAAAGAAGKPETSAEAAAGGQSGDALLLAGLAVTLQAEVSR